MDCFSSDFYPSVSTKYFWYLPWPNRVKKKKKTHAKGTADMPFITELLRRRTSELTDLVEVQAGLWARALVWDWHAWGRDSLMHVFCSGSYPWFYNETKRTGGRRHLCHCSLYCTFIFSKKEKKFFGEFKFFMLFHSEQMNLFPKIIRKLFQHVSYVTLS